MFNIFILQKKFLSLIVDVAVDVLIEFFLSVAQTFGVNLSLCKKAHFLPRWRYFTKKSISAFEKNGKSKHTKKKKKEDCNRI